MTATYFLGSQLLATGQAWWSGTERMSHSTVYLCPGCGEPWGRVFLPGVEWVPVRLGCPRHPWPRPDLPGGSFLPPWQSNPSLLPPALLAREFLIHLNHALGAQNAN